MFKSVWGAHASKSKAPRLSDLVEKAMNKFKRLADYRLEVPKQC